MATSFESAEIDELLSGLSSFLEAEVVKRHEDGGEALSNPRHLFDEDGRFSQHALATIREVREASAEAGYYTMFVPAELGGGGLGSEALFRVWEMISHRFGPHNWLAMWSVAHWTKGPSHVLAHSTPEVRERVLPDLLAGKTSMCFGMSEPDAGSDALRMRTRAVRDGDDWVISGSKQWISNAPYADHIVIFAGTDAAESADGKGAYSAFLVPTDATGLTVDNNLMMFGHIGGDEGLVYLDEVRVRSEQLLGEVGQGFKIAMSGVLVGRMYNCAKVVGLGRFALDMGLEYVQRREAFGRAIAANQGVTFPLADSAMKLRAARLMSLDVARLIDNNVEARKELSMAKAYSTEVATEAIDRVVQVHGAMGFTNELGLTEAWQSTRKVCVADGTSEILRRTIVRDLLAGNTDL
jgi:acyl-CoA dehydrogenase